jgi:hypothetical protein
MKHFCFAIKDCGKNCRGRVYRISKNSIEPVTSFEFRYGSTRGAIHEAYKALIDCGEIPKRWWKSSECGWMGAGYYSGKVTEVYSIQEVYV